ncbi:FAD-binding oxidoreductase [Cystobacter fuscus]|uniref:FAD-binding oxidoreductase n=1 Tax=Cystobacter fuscus TaxID=43 RepID=UPI002B2F37BE|nr:FAD-binding oxidoreductase [Cystobacter fuscus]
MSPPALSLLDDLRGGLSGPLRSTPEELELYAHDFGGLVRRVPRVVVRARCEADVVHTLRVARAHGVRVTVRGSGHSTRGQVLDEGGIILDNRAEGGEVRLLDGGRVEVSARTRWGQVEEALNAAGRTLPVLTSVPGATVGGTLSEGGFGTRSLHQGAQVDHVERLRLVLADGTALWCGPGEEPDLFRLALAGFGQVGVLERVVLATLPSRPLTRLQLNPHGGLSDLVEAVAWTETWRESTPEHFLGLWKEGRFWSVFGRDFPDEASATRAPLPEPLARMTRERAELDAPPQLLTWSDEDDTRQRHPWRRRVWCDYCLDLEGLRGFARFLEGRPGWMSGLESVSLLGLANPPGRTRGPFDMRPPTQRAERLYALGLYHGVDVGDGPGLRAAEALHQACLEWCVRAGGRPSLRGGSVLDAASLRGLYAEDLSLLRTWRASRDPSGLLNPHGLPAGLLRE